MTKSILPLCFMCLGLFSLAHGQTFPGQPPVPKIITELHTPDPNNRRANVIQSPDIARLLYFHTENQLRKDVTGFRILIFSESGSMGRQNAQDVRSRFFTEFPGIEPYFVWDSPHYKVYVGDFRTHTEALRNLKKIVRTYRNAIIVDNTSINP